MLPSDKLFRFLLGGLAAGLAVGSLPLLIALRQNREALGYSVFAACVLVSFVFGLDGGVPVAAVAVLILFSTSKKRVEP